MNHNPDKKSVELLGNAMDMDQLPSLQEQSLPLKDQPGSVQNRQLQASRKGGKTVFVYLAILFAAAFSMLLLAYFVQQRNNEAAMVNLQSIGNLIDDNQNLRDQLHELESSLAVAEEKVEQITQENSIQQDKLEDARQQQDILILYIMLEQQVRQENYDAAATTLQHLSQFGESLNLPISEVDPGDSFDLTGRLQEIALILDRLG